MTSRLYETLNTFLFTPRTDAFHEGSLSMLNVKFPVSWGTAGQRLCKHICRCRCNTCRRGSCLDALASSSYTCFAVLFHSILHISCSFSPIIFINFDFILKLYVYERRDAVHVIYRITLKYIFMVFLLEIMNLIYRIVFIKIILGWKIIIINLRSFRVGDQFL